MKKTHYAWAIDTRSESNHGFIGQFWHFREGGEPVPVHMKGTRTALFRTRQDARDALHKTKRAFPSARVVKVRVTIEVES